MFNLFLASNLHDNINNLLQSTAFKKAFSIDVDIELVGVWYAIPSAPS
jgi:hypothetical protein